MTVSISKLSKLFGIFLVCCLPFAGAWWPVGHYAVARKCGVPHEEAGLYNLPDAWNSHDWTYSITDNFCWSHSVARDGRNGIVPRPPVYHLTREPGKIIKDLVDKNKVAHWSTGNQCCTEDTALNTAKYFTGHNAADKDVHWAYFQGGTIPQWMTHHETKEEWADYAILMYFGKITFKSDGSIDTFWDSAVDDSVPPMPFDTNSINCPIIVLAQKVARKNRVILDAEDMSPDEDVPYTYDSVDSVATVESLVQGLATKVNDKVREMNRNKWRELLEIAVDHNWMTVTINDLTGEEKYYFVELVTKFNSAVKNFNDNMKKDAK